MIKARAWPAKAMYILIAAALAISLIIIAAPALKVSADPGLSEWTRVSTPTTDDWLMAPESVIIDYAVADEGEVAYAIVYQWDGAVDAPLLLKSTDGAATWNNLTEELMAELEDDGYTLNALMRVATDPDDSDFVAVALNTNEPVITSVHVYISTDGGATFMDTGEVEDGGRFLPVPEFVADLAVSPEDDGERDIAIVGMDDQGDAVIFRCTVVGDSASAWEDARYDGWDNDYTVGVDPNEFTSMWVTWVEFAPSWAADRTILVTTVAPTSTGPGPWDVHLQSGTWGTSEGWNADSVLAIDAVPIVKGVELPIQFTVNDARALAGLTLPLDYSGRNSDKRYVWVWVNYYDPPPVTACTIFRVKI